MKEYTLEVAPLAPTIKQQLDEYGVYMSTSNYEKYEKLRKAILMVGFHVATESQIRPMWKKFYNQIQEDIYDKPVE